MAQPISSSPLASAFRCFQFDLENAANTTPTKLGELFQHLRDYEAADVAGKPALMMTALKAIRALSTALQGATFRARDLSLNPKVHRCYDDGVEVILLIKGSKGPQAWSETALKLKALVADYLPGNSPIVETLVAQANAQQASIVSSDLCTGLCGCFEMAACRPHLSQRAAVSPFLANIARVMTGLMGSFAEVGFNAQTRNEGIQLLGQLADLLKTNQAALANLYEPNTAVARLISRLVALSQPEFATIYDPIRDAAISACYDRAITPQHSAVTVEHVVALFKEQAKTAADALPDHLKPNYSSLNELNFEAAHHGALLFGSMNNHGALEPGSVMGQIPGSTVDLRINASNPTEVDNAVVEKFKKITEERAYIFYGLHQLLTIVYTHADGTLIPSEISDPIQQARATVNLMADYQIEQHANEHQLLFGLTPSQKEALRLEKIVQVVIFGIQHDIFNPAQILVLLGEHPHLNEAPEIKQALKAAVIRFTQKVESALELETFALFLQTIPILNGAPDQIEINQALNAARQRLVEREQAAEEVSRFPNPDDEFARFGNLPYNEDV